MILFTSDYMDICRDSTNIHGIDNVMEDHEDNIGIDSLNIGIDALDIILRLGDNFFNDTRKNKI